MGGYYARERLKRREWPLWLERLIAWWRNLPGLPFRIGLRLFMRGLQHDEALRWTWHCGFIDPIISETGVSRARANATAVGLMHALFRASTVNDVGFQHWKRESEAEREGQRDKAFAAARDLPPHFGPRGPRVY